MSCQKVLSMLSAYIDGEVQTSDAEMIKTHLSECDSCAAEWRALQSMTGMLRTTPEVEPPAFLLAQIEAATVNKTGFITKVQRAFDQVPTMVRWASAPVAAAIVLLGILLSNNGEVQTPVAVKSPTERIQNAIPGMPGLPTITIEEQTPSAAAVAAGRVVAKASGSSARSRRTFAGTKSMSGHKPAHPAAVKGTDVGDADGSAEAKLEEPVIDGVEIAENTPAEPGSDITKAVMTDQSVSIAKASDEKPVKKAVVLDDPSGMDQLRSKLAIRNKSKFNSREDRIEGKKYSVELVSLRF